MTQTPNIPARKEERYFAVTETSTVAEMFKDLNAMAEILTGVAPYAEHPSDAQNRLLDAGVDADEVANRTAIFRITVEKLEQTL